MFEQEAAPRNYEQEIARLAEELATLKEAVKESEAEEKASENSQSPRSRTLPSRRVRARRTLVPGYQVTTLEGSLYDAILRGLATAGKLEQQEFLFQRFQKHPSIESAQRLLGMIAIYKSELEALLKVDADYQEHCDKRTHRLQRLVAAGNAQAVGILANPKICKDGRWIGDVKEAINILRGGRTTMQLDRGRNVRILRQAGLMFDAIQQEGVQDILFLYPRKHHRLMRRARALAGV